MAWVVSLGAHAEEKLEKTRVTSGGLRDANRNTWAEESREKEKRDIYALPATWYTNGILLSHIPSIAYLFFYTP